jgi:hypothetical protein
MKRIVLLAIAILVPALLFLNTWQGYRYHQLSEDVAALEKRQRQTVEDNMGLVARISFERSRARIEERAAADGALAPIPAARVTRVLVTGSQGQ